MDYILILIPIIGGILSIVKFLTDGSKNKTKDLVYIFIISILLSVSLSMYMQKDTNKEIDRLLSTYQKKQDMAFILSSFSYISEHKENYSEQYKTIKIYKNQAIYYHNHQNKKEVAKISKDILEILMILKR